MLLALCLIYKFNIEFCEIENISMKYISLLNIKYQLRHTKVHFIYNNL
jgi:hypothetical protein